MGEAIVEISVEVLRELMTTGWRGDGVECAEGLPPTAKCVATWALSTRTVSLVFSDKSFKPIGDDAVIPHIAVRFKKTFNEPNHTST